MCGGVTKIKAQAGRIGGPYLVPFSSACQSLFYLFLKKVLEENGLYGSPDSGILLSEGKPEVLSKIIT